MLTGLMMGSGCQQTACPPYGDLAYNHDADDGNHGTGSTQGRCLRRGDVDTDVKPLTAAEAGLHKA